MMWSCLSVGMTQFLLFSILSNAKEIATFSTFLNLKWSAWNCVINIEFKPPNTFNFLCCKKFYNTSDRAQLDASHSPAREMWNGEPFYIDKNRGVELTYGSFFGCTSTLLNDFLAALLTTLLGALSQAWLISRLSISAHSFSRLVCALEDTSCAFH